MEKSNLPLPLKKRTFIREAISGVRDGSKMEKRTTVQLRRDSSGRVLKERPQFSGSGGSYLKKRFVYNNSKKTGIPFSLKGSKAVVNSLCAAGDFADACFPAAAGNTADSVLESAGVKRGALSMKSKLLQLQERNRLILAKQQLPRSSSVHTHQLNPYLTSAMLMTPLTLQIETTDEEAKTCSQQARLPGESSCSTSPIYHELDPIEDVHSSPEQHTYQSISEVREEMARLQAQINLGSTIGLYACGDHIPVNNCLKISELSTRESQKRIYSSGTVQESEPKQNRTKRSIFSKFWLSRRNLLSNQDDAIGEEKAVLTSMTSLNEDEIHAPHVGDGLGNHPSGVGLSSSAQPSSIHFAISRKHPRNTTAVSSSNAYGNHPITAEDLHNIDSCCCRQGFYIPTDSSCRSIACDGSTCSNRDGVGNPYDCYYGWKSDDEIESDAKTGPVFQKTLQSFAKRSSVVKAGTKSRTEEYFSSTELANALTEYHWSIYQTGNLNKNETLSSSRRTDGILEASIKDTPVCTAFHQDPMVSSHFLPAPLTPDQSNACSVINMKLLDTSPDICTHNVDTAFLHHSRPATSSRSGFRGKIPHSQFSSPCCGIRMAEMRAVRRKSESALLFEPSAPICVQCSTMPRHSKQEEMLHHSPTVESSPSTQSEPSMHLGRNMQTILEEDQLTENTSSCHLAHLPSPPPPLSPGTGDWSSGNLSKHSDSSQMESALSNSTVGASDSLNANAECKIPEEMLLSSDGSSSSTNDYEKKSGELWTNGASQTKQSNDSKTTVGSKLKKPKPVRHRTPTAASPQTKPTMATNNTGDCSEMLHLQAAEQQQQAASSKARKTETAAPSASLSFTSNRTIEREPKPLIRQALIRQIESVSPAAQVDIGLELLESPRPTQRTLQPTTSRLKPGSCIPRTKNLSMSHTYSADDKPTPSSCLREADTLKKRVDCLNQKKRLNNRSLEKGIGLLTFSRSYSADVAFKEKEDERLHCFCSDDSMRSSEKSDRCESTSYWEGQGQPPEVNCFHNPDCCNHKKNTQMASPSEYLISEISSLSSSLTSSNSSSSVFGVMESESDSTTSSCTRDLELELESPSSASSASSKRTDTQPNASVAVASQDAVPKEAESTATKPQRGKSQLPAPRTDATRCLERLERLRIETKQTKNEFHQKLRH